MIMINTVHFTLALTTPWQTYDPFLFCMHHIDYFPKANDNMGPDASLSGRNIGSDFSGLNGWNMYHGSTIPGFPAHPHRGFETISIIERGYVDHSDSLGSKGRFGEGDVQWMTAGSGIQHCEMSPLINRDKPNTKESFQIWLNLPAKNKMVPPEYKMLWKESIPIISEYNDQGKRCDIKLIAGNWRGECAISPAKNSWASDPDNEVNIWKIVLEKGASISLPQSQQDISRTLYIFKGDSVLIDQQHELKPNYLASLDSMASTFIEAKEGTCELLVLQGKPINEPVAQHGPFVMNTQEELIQTFQDYNRTGFGNWPWPRKDMVHPRESARFAYHSDGRHEEP